MRSSVLLSLSICLMLAVTSAHAAVDRSVRQRDWRNGEYDLGDGLKTSFVGGQARTMEDGVCAVCLAIRDVTFGDVDGDGREEAVLLIDSNLGGAGTSLDGYVFGLQDGRPLLREHVPGGDRGDGGIESVSISSGHVIVRRFELGPRDGACCPSRVSIERWRWENGHLVKEAVVAVRKRKPVRWDR
jgi:hypothetical protein